MILKSIKCSVSPYKKIVCQFSSMMQHRHYMYKLIAILIGALSILSAICLVSYFQNPNVLLQNISDLKNSYDYIIVGGGTTGCVLAAKLSENKNKSVLLVEAGDEFNFLASIPLYAVLLQGSKNDWSYKSQSQKYSSFGYNNQSQSLPRGKGLGGSNQINFMVHGYDLLKDLDRWQTFGVQKWDHDNPYLHMQRLFTEKDYFKHDNSTINISETKTELGKLFSLAAKDLRNNNTKHSFGKSTITNGQRWTTYHSHLKSVIERDNLDIILNTRVAKIIFNDKHATAVKLVDSNNNIRIIKNNDEVILSSGTFNSPQILLLSGIGPRYVLDELRIPVIYDLPGVGKNLHDHLNMPLYISINTSISITTNKILRVREIFNYLVHKKGLFSQSPIGGIIKQEEIGLLLFELGSTDEKIFREVANLKFEIFESMFPLYQNSSQEGFVLLATCLKPSSRGFVSIKTNNIFAPPIIDPKYLSNLRDIECTTKAVKLAEEIIKTNAFQKIGAKIHWPRFKNCKHENKEYLECIIRTGGITAHHPGGTCKMGPTEDPFTIVDGTFRVKGVTGLRIIDASILPEPLSTFPNAFLTIMAEHASQVIKNKTKINNR